MAKADRGPVRLCRSVTGAAGLADGRFVLCRLRHDAHGPAAAVRAERYGAGREREQRVVAATAYADAGVEVRAPLADEDFARVHALAAETLDAKPLSIGVAAVPAG